jgi:GntR family transcriptional regulator
MADASPRSAGPPAAGQSPLFVQVRDALRADILDGALGPGERLPSESALIERFGVSRITVRQALAELQSSGLVQTVNGKGSYVTRPGRGVAQGPLVGVLEAMRKRGHRARGRLLSHRVVKASRAVARHSRLLSMPRAHRTAPVPLPTTWT